MPAEGVKALHSGSELCNLSTFRITYRATYIYSNLFQDFFASGMAFFLIGAGSTSSALLKLYIQ